MWQAAKCTLKKPQNLIDSPSAIQKTADFKRPLKAIVGSDYFGDLIKLKTKFPKP